MAQRIVHVPWDQQPQELSPVDPDHPLGRALDAAWIGNDLGGTDALKGHKVALLSATTIGRTTRGNAFTHTGTAGSLVAVPGEAALPYVQIGYGYFNTAGGAWQLSRLGNSAGGYESRLALASSTTVAADVRWNFGTSRNLTITLPTTLNTPICMALVAYSSTDYRFFANGQQQNGTLSPGTFASLDRMYAPGDTLNGGLWFTGFGSGASLSDEELLRITANPEAELWSMFRRRIWVPVGAVGGGDLTLALTGQGSTASAGSLALSRSSALGGQAAATSAGTLAPSRSVAASGQGVTASAGTLTGSRSASLSGQAATASAGTLAPSATVALSGQAVTASAGTITYNASGNVTLALTGQAVAASAGTLPVTLTKAATGSAATASAGTAVPGIGISASGSAVTGSAGTLALGIAVPAAGSAATAAAGTLTYGTAGNVTVALSGSPVTAYAGTLLYELADLVLSAPPIGHGPAMTRRTSPQGQARRAVLNTRTR